MQTSNLGEFVLICLLLQLSENVHLIAFAKSVSDGREEMIY